MDTCVCMAESLYFSPETITTLLIGYTPIRKKKSSGSRQSRVLSFTVSEMQPIPSQVRGQVSQEPLLFKICMYLCVYKLKYS